MTNHIYPDEIDCVWLASDKDGYLGVFVTAGQWKTFYPKNVER